MIFRSLRDSASQKMEVQMIKQRLPEVDPETAPKSVQLALVVMGNPPGRCPTKTFSIRINRLADSPDMIILADRINIGTRTNAGGVTPVIICMARHLF